MPNESKTLENDWLFLAFNILTGLKSQGRIPWPLGEHRCVAGNPTYGLIIGPALLASVLFSA